MKFIFASLVLLVASVQLALADVYSQLQFMKIISPTNGQSIEAGSDIVLQYVMQPTVYEGTSNGYAKSLQVNFHTRSGESKLEQVAHVCTDCPVAAKESKYVTYTKSYKIPADTAPGSYALDFVELVQLRRSQITSTETVSINIVN
ncbi:hypothetical protein K501DRAFT_251087, partial [Backusella circina FSU 941]